METKYELHHTLMNSNYPLKIKKELQTNNGYLHWHENLELLYFLSGKCKVINGNEEMSVAAGEIVVFNSEAVHRVKAEGIPCEYIIVQLNAAYFKAMGFDFGESTIQKIIHDDEICTIMKKALREQEDNMPYYRETVKAWMLQMLVILFRKHLAEDFHSSDQSSKSKLIKRVAEYIKLHYNEELTVQEISEKCGYSRFYISKAFKEITGYTVISYINATRIERAKTLLTNGSLSMGEIAMQCGFINQSYFSKVFKRLETISPHEYRARINK